MDELTKQVKSELLRTLIWLVIAMGVGSGVYLAIWK